ncbi:MAG: MFS transporter [Desulfobacterales bacterium]|jgi:MFS family permease
MQHRSFGQLGTSKNAAIMVKPTGRLGKCRLVEPWYLSYAILGCTMGGMFPILIPLLALKRFSSRWHVGLVMSAFNLGGLMAPIWGSVADRYGIHRGLLSSGLIITAIALAALSYTSTFSFWLGLALMQGIGVFVAMTVGNLFIVEIHPKSEWNERIGWLQTFNSGGQVSGMLIAAALSQIDLNSSLLVAASLVALAVLPGCLTPRMPPQTAGYRLAGLCHDRQYHRTPESSQFQFNYRKFDPLRHLNSIRNTPFEHFMGVWFLCVGGVSAIYTLYPVMMQEVYGIGQELLSLIFGAAMGLSVFLYAQAGHLTQRFGPTKVLQSFLGLRLMAFLCFFLLGLFHFGGSIHLVLLSFFIVVLCWPFLIVSGTALTALLSPFGEGEGMGFFCADFAIACVIGPSLGGWLAARWGYNAVSGMAVVTEASGLMLMHKIIQNRLV